MSILQEYVFKNSGEKTLTFFFDVETLQYNEEKGYITPSDFKNITYVYGVGFFENGERNIILYENLKMFLDDIINGLQHRKTKPRINLIAHNTNKYDNHFLKKDLQYYYDGFEVFNLFMNKAIKEGNTNTVKKTDLPKIKDRIILEKRIKSGNNLELTFFINNIEFYTTDNWIKTNASIKVLGEKLEKLGIITENELKTSYDYTKYNKYYDMTNRLAREYASQVFKQLSLEEITYIKNDIIILMESKNNYSKIFDGFDYSRITYTTNILDYYNDNDLTSYQLLKRIGQGKGSYHVKYTNFKFNGQNFYDYLKTFYNGGNNFYNDNYVGKIISTRTFAIDINSSYPYIMYKYKIPTFLNSYKEFEHPTLIKIGNIKNNNKFTLYRLSKKDFDREIIDNVDSIIVKQMLVKYYGKHDTININTNTLLLLKEILKININQLTVLSYVTFDCYLFGSRDKISKQYEIKEKGSSKFKLIYKDPFNIIVTNEPNKEIYSSEEVDISKIILNGIYGIPALRSHFNLFRWHDNELININNGYENSERNIVFSIFITSMAFYNLLEPFKNLTPNEIDENFIYCDTDSIFMKYNIIDKIDKEMFDNHVLGKWSFDEENIFNLSVLNHKKYAYESFNKKKNKVCITVKCGGIPNDSFNTDLNFQQFVKEQFSEGVEIKNQKSIYNNDGTISIYDSITKLDIGNGYRLFSNDEYLDNQINLMKEEIRNSYVPNGDDLLYIESNLGTFSQSDLFPFNYEVEAKEDLDYLLIYEKNARLKLGLS